MTEQHIFDSAIYEGTVFHRRAAPKAHGFRYGVYSLLIDLDELPALTQQITGFPTTAGIFSLSTIVIMETEMANA